MRASSTLKRDDGTSAFSWRAEIAFLRRVRRSETGSVTFISPSSLPGRLRHARDVPGEREIAETDAAHAELAAEAPRTSAARTAVALADRVLQLRVRLGDRGATSHFGRSLAYRPNGMPSSRRRTRARSSEPAVVTMVTLRPLDLSILVGSISGKITWSFTPRV